MAISYRLRIVNIQRKKTAFFLVSVLADFDKNHTIILVITAQQNIC